MKFLLVAINAKYIHSNLAVFSLKAYAEQYGKNKNSIEIAEYTINQYKEEIIQSIYSKKPDAIGFSCYIWNINLVKDIIEDYKKINPNVHIFLGGPEVSYNMKQVLEENKAVDYIMYGEGEEIFKNVLDNYEIKKGNLKLCKPDEIKGIAFRKESEVVITLPEEPLDLSKIPFVYKDMKEFENKIIYYETSRGCPFSCSYCLSSVDKHIRFRDMKLIKEELKFFIDNKTAQVKLVDRTFNCNPKRTIEILNFIKENDNGITNFHFEIAANLITEEELDIIKNMRPRLIQLETGVQSTNNETIHAINRKTDFEKIKETTEKIKSFKNTHQHLDLIAGLPYENYDSFKKSFDDVYKIKPDQLQLGFLKVLHGSEMKNKSEDYGIVYSSKPPYEVIKTKWLTYEEVLKLKKIENAVELYYNSTQFENTIKMLEGYFESPFKLYEELGEFYHKKSMNGEKHSRVSKYEILLEFIKKNISKSDKFRDLLTVDFYLRENAKTRPQFSRDLEPYKKTINNVYHGPKLDEILKEYKENTTRQKINMTHVEVIENKEGKEKYLLFNYKKRNPLNNQATVIDVTELI